MNCFKYSDDNKRNDTPVRISLNKLRFFSAMNRNLSFSFSERLLNSMSSFDTFPGKKIISPSFSTYSNSTRCTGKIYKFTLFRAPFLFDYILSLFNSFSTYFFNKSVESAREFLYHPLILYNLCMQLH